ncbi:MAG: hypothetical protein P0Y53_05745 [Candidatus Pseudobacter hemicellulosilyticus]|uniref:Uncharacterized protein n=1 Tax=Candidatus Pseudobacter hemicellulosilyticus TaxID=3121375 RepID=A0AAJ5WUH4_9BACT|nr:MAG: hypothetical protein P0Y53_05745 [Pseudobacter sp.]
MNRPTIVIAFRQLINAQRTAAFEQTMLRLSYQEFLLKSQAYNPEGRYDRFTALVKADGRANSLHYKTSFAVIPLIEQLNGRIPLLKDTFEKPLPFERTAFELVESSISDFSLHAVALTYYTPPLLLLESFGGFLLLSADVEQGSEPFMLQVNPNLSITSYQLPVMAEV